MKRQSSAYSTRGSKSIGWKIITKPKVEYYLPDQMELKKR